MKISKEPVMEIIKAVRSIVEPEVIEAPLQDLSVYYLDDITLSFTTTERADFYGLMFEALGRDFSIINNLEVLFSAENDEGDEESFSLESPELIKHLEDFLRWRAEVIRSFGA